MTLQMHTLSLANNSSHQVSKINPQLRQPYFSDTEALTSTGETVSEIIDRAMAGANVSDSAGEESAREESTEQFGFIHELNYPEIVVRRVKHSRICEKTNERKEITLMVQCFARMPIWL